MAKNIQNSSVVFMYHRFGESKHPSTNVSIEQFKSHLEEFSKSKYNVATLNFIVDSFSAETSLPKNTIAITVDDGYRSFLTEAWPLLKKYGFPATMFISTEPIDAGIRGYLTWEEIRQLKSEGLEIGAHTRTHAHLNDLSINTIKEEIEHSNKRFLEEINEIPKLFSYPFGETSNAIINLIKDYKFSAAFGQHSGVINETSNFYYLPRFSINEKYGNIERIQFTANAKGLGIYDFIPIDPLLNENPPFIGFSLLDKDISDKLNCFIFDSNGTVDSDKYIFGERVEIRLKRKLTKGRTRLNCTTKDKEGNWRWFGRQLFMPNNLD